MKSRLAISLYYKLFFVFGISFLLIISTLLLTNRDQNFLLNIAGLLLVVVILISNGYLIRKMLKPLDEMKKSAREFGAGKFNGRVSTDSSDEIGELGQALNTMAGQIQSQVEALKQMAVGVSHEIRSPLARMRLVTESLTSDDSRRLLNNEIQNIDRIVEMTIEREALDNGLSQLLLQPIIVNELLLELAAYYQECGEKISIDLPNAPVLLTADRRRLEMLFKNLLDNCFEHGRSAAGAKVVLQLEGKRGSVIITDKGPGIGSDDLQRGLGLRLCASIAKAHGMELTVDTASTTGSSTILSWDTIAH
ncbi:MAG: HAMP domain-containing protein [Proteobacteria bacterium]|nr:MAG: HAMP domain-containing protein [Pseudomonadota bacterium]